MAKEIKKMAVFVGCTYTGTEVQLQGPINDVNQMRDLVVQRFGFEPSNIEFLTDAPDSTVMPTGANIRSALKMMFNRAEAGDVLFFHFSGHATRVPRSSVGDGEYEAIVPSDFNLILDEEFRELVSCLPEGASFTFLSDSCLANGFIDIKKDHIGPPMILFGGLMNFYLSAYILAYGKSR
ncbi:metacaspase-9-like [Silene latifolia]|uniref:metacaspase-9-like n=1 Tax=Silene latifolia TaxID=37657 RepID=UPI003D782742